MLKITVVSNRMGVFTVVYFITFGTNTVVQYIGSFGNSVVQKYLIVNQKQKL